MIGNIDELPNDINNYLENLLEEYGLDSQIFDKEDAVEYLNNMLKKLENEDEEE